MKWLDVAPNRSWVVAILGVLALGVILSLMASARFGGFDIRDERGRVEPVTMPYLTQGWGPGVYRLEGDMRLAWFGPRRYQIIPDDELLELRINDRPVDISGIPLTARRDVTKGFHIDLSQYLHAGSNRVAFTFRDYGGDMGMSMKRSPGDWRTLVVGGVWLVLGLMLVIRISRAIGQPWHYGVAYVLVVVGCAIQAWYIIQYNPVNHIFSDPARHWEQGIDVLRIDLMSMTDPILYQVYVALLAKVTLKIPALVAYFTILLAWLGPWLWYRFLRELQGSKALALAGWAALSLLPSWTAIYAYFMQETLMLPLLGGALWATWRCRRKADPASFVIMVLLWIAAGLTRGIAIPLAAVACTWLWLVQDQKIRKGLYSSLALLLIMGPLTYRSFQTVNHFAPHGMGHMNVIYAQSGKKVIEVHSNRQGGRWVHGFGSPSTGAEPFKPFSDWKSQRTGTQRIFIGLDKGTEDWRTASEQLQFGFKDYLWITKENLIFLFFSESWPDNNLSRVVDVLSSVMRWLWVPLFVFLILVTAISGRRFRGQWLLPSLILAWFIVQALVPIAVNEGRYRKPFEGLAIAHLILWLAVLRGTLRPAAPCHSPLAPVRALWHRVKALRPSESIHSVSVEES